MVLLNRVNRIAIYGIINTDEQLISIYYTVNSNAIDSIQQNQKSLDIDEGDEHTFLWKKIEDLSEADVTYAIDKLVVKFLVARHSTAV